MALVMPGRVERSARGGEVFGRTGPETRGREARPPRHAARMAETAAAPGIDVCRLVVAAAGLSAGLVLPAALVTWAAFAVLDGLGERVLAMMP